MTLVVRNLNVEFHLNKEKVHAVRHLSFDVAHGEMVALVGESGCGKSVTAKALMHLLPPRTAFMSCAKMKLDEVDLMKKRASGTDIAMVFQDPFSSLNPTLNIGKQIGECVKKCSRGLSRAKVKERVIELLHLVRLPYPEVHYHQYPFELSGGMCQRVCIAMAFAFDPKVIIADEPTTALDVTIQAQILELMKDLQKQTKTTILFITHDLSLVARYCDRAMVMYAGQIVESASIDDLFHNPQHPYTKLLLKSLPYLNSERLVPIEGQPPKLNRRIIGCPFFERCPSAMNICKKKGPKMTPHNENHSSKCWIHEAPTHS